MAYDDIVKALTIQITADDLTGGMWSSVGKGVKTVWDNVTALNQAWELGAKAYGVLADALETPVAVLSAGGAYAEAKAGFEAMSESYGVNGQRVVDIIRDISEGEVGLMEATQAASNAIKKGFSNEQTELILQFAKKYEDVMGGDFLQIASEIEKSIVTGNAKAAKSYDLPIEKGMEWSKVATMLNEKMSAMGEGVFNFGDSWKGMLQSVDDVYLSVYERMNSLAGEDGIEGFTGDVRFYMSAIEDAAASVATSIYYPIRDSLKALIGPFAAIGDVIDEVFGISFKNTENIASQINNMMRTMGNLFYEVAIGLSESLNVAFTPLDVSLRAISLGLSKIIEGMIKVDEITGFWSKVSPDSVGMLKEYGQTLAEMYDLGFAKIDVSGIIKKQEAYNKAMDESTKILFTAKKQQEETAVGIKKVGEAYEDTEKKTKSATKAVVESIESINKYGGVLFQANLLAQAGKIGTKEYEDLMKKASGATATTTALTPSITSTTTASGLLKTAAATTAKSGKLDVSLSGIDAKLKDFVEYIIDQVTTKAIAEGLITAGV